VLVPERYIVAYDFLVLEDNLRDQSIEKLPDIEWKKKLLEVKNISLKDAMDKVRLWESAREQATQMVNGVKM